MIPSTIHPSVRSGAERKLFAVFRDAPATDDWVCLHSLGLARHATKRRGEIDFLLLTRNGFFVLEVKGGRVSREDGVWRFTDRYGTTYNRNESPFDQASSAMFTLEKEVKMHFRDGNRRCQLLFGFGLMFPDILFDVTGTEADRRQVYDLRDRRQHIEQFIERLAIYWRERCGRDRFAPTKRDIDTTVDFLRGDFDPIPSLGIQADTIAEQMLSLEKEQYAVLDVLEQFRKPRILIQGGAGTGKTLLAIEAAKREARKESGDILLLCYNRLLASFLEAKVKTEHRGGQRITVKSIYSLLNDLIESSSQAAEFRRQREVAGQTSVYRELFPKYAPLALAENGVTPFRTLIIDEAQDMMTQGMLDVIDAYVEGGLEAGHWLIFCDVNNQSAVFGAFEEPAQLRLLSFGHALLLPMNRRNTKPIADETAMLAQPKIRANATIDGIPVKYSWYNKPEDQVSALARILKQLLSEGLSPSQITVLSPHRAENSCAAALDDPPLVQLTIDNVREIAAGAFDSVSHCSISAFKGLENDFVILTDIEGLDTEWWRSVVYVGMSRARTGLHLLLNQSLRPTYEQRLRHWLEEHVYNMSGEAV